jgi:hypothetical protein
MWRWSNTAPVQAMTYTVDWIKGHEFNMYIKSLTTFPQLENANALFFSWIQVLPKMYAENTFKIILYLRMHEVQQVHQRFRIPVQ